MNTTLKTVIKTLALGILLTASIHPAQAAVTPVAHTYVSGTATTDTYPCSRTAPCATFAGALGFTASGGVITALDAGDYGTVVITNQSVTIDGTGTQASIVTNSGNDAIAINAGAGNTVILRHLVLTGLSNSNNGVYLSSGNLVMDDCKISGFVNNNGILISSSGNAVVENTTITGCIEGVYSYGAGLLSLRSVTLQGNQYGLDAEGGPTDISHSQITQNSFAGLYAYGVNGAGSGTLSASGCMVSGNGTGVYADSGGLIRLTNNDLFNNTIGIDSTTSGSIVSTTGNNRKAGNGTSGSVTPGKVIIQQ